MIDITYTRVGDYDLPNIALTQTAPLGKYGVMHKEYLRKNKPGLYAELLLTERLYPICREIDEAAAHKLKSTPDCNAAHEAILAELVHC